MLELRTYEYAVAELRLHGTNTHLLPRGGGSMWKSEGLSNQSVMVMVEALVVSPTEGRRLMTAAYKICSADTCCNVSALIKIAYGITLIPKQVNELLGEDSAICLYRDALGVTDIDVLPNTVSVQAAADAFAVYWNISYPLNIPRTDVSADINIREVVRIANGLIYLYDKRVVDPSQKHDLEAFLEMRLNYPTAIRKLVVDQLTGGKRNMQDISTAMQWGLLATLVDNQFLGTSAEVWRSAIAVGRVRPELLTAGPKHIKSAIKTTFGNSPIGLITHPDYEALMRYTVKHATTASFQLDEIRQDGLRLLQLDPNSGIDLIAGDYVGSCQSWKGGGESCAKHAVKSKRGATWAVYHKSRMIAHAWVWTPKGRDDVLVLDNIESGVIKQNKDLLAKVSVIFEEGINQMLDNGMSWIGVGTQYTDTKLPNRSKKVKNPYTAPVDYTDADEVWVYGCTTAVYSTGKVSSKLLDIWPE